MNKKKIVLIWIALMTLIVLLVNTACLWFMSHMDDILTPSMAGYVKKADSLLYPVETAEKKEDKEKQEKMYSGLCNIRSLFSNERLDSDSEPWKVFFGGKIRMDEALRFAEKDGNSELVSGIYAIVHDETVESTIRGNVGIVDVNKLVSSDISKELYKTLEQNRDSKVQLNSYTKKGVLITPVSVTVSDSNGGVLLKTKYPYDENDGELIKDENIIIMNEKEDEQAFTYGDLYLQMNLAYCGERDIDKNAKEIAENIEFKEDSVHKKSYGLASFKSTTIESTEDHALIIVYKYRVIEMFLAWTILLGIVMTVVMVKVAKADKI